MMSVCFQEEASIEWCSLEDGAWDPPGLVLVTGQSWAEPSLLPTQYRWHPLARSSKDLVTVSLRRISRSWKMACILLYYFFLFYYYFSTFSLTIYYLNATAKGQKAANLDLKKKMKMVRMRFTETSSYLVSRRRKGGVLTAAPVSSGVASAGEQDAEQEDGGRPRRWEALRARASFLSCRRAPRFALFLQMEGSIAGGLPEVGNSVHSPMARVSSLRFIFREMGCFTRNFKRGERKKT